MNKGKVLLERIAVVIEDFHISGFETAETLLAYIIGMTIESGLNEDDLINWVRSRWKSYENVKKEMIDKDKDQ